jgi:hypothetical protein
MLRQGPEEEARSPQPFNMLYLDAEGASGFLATPRPGLNGNEIDVSGIGHGINLLKVVTNCSF